MPSVHSNHDHPPSSLSRIVNRPFVVLWCNAWDRHRMHSVCCFGSARMHQPWESHRVHFTIRSTLPMSWFRMSFTISPCDHIHPVASSHPSYHQCIAHWVYESIVQGWVWFDDSIEHGFLPCQQIDVFVIPLLVPFIIIASKLSLGMFVVFQVPSECLSHDGLERTADQFQRVFELNTMEFNLHFLVLGGGNDFQISIVFVHRCDEFHDECEIVVRSIVEVHWKSIVLLVEWKL